VEYVYPMHPEMGRKEPGNCLLCGMILEPVSATVQTGSGRGSPAHTHVRGEPAAQLEHAHSHPTGHDLGVAAPDVGSKEVEYTCHMHPQVRQIGPGSCPICGMALEPVVATATASDSPELRDMTRRFWIGLALTVPVFALEMGSRGTRQTGRAKGRPQSIAPYLSARADQDLYAVQGKAGWKALPGRATASFFAGVRRMRLHSPG